MKLHFTFADVVLLGGLFISTVIAIAVGIKARRITANIWILCFLIASVAFIIVKILYSTGYILLYPHWFKINYPAGILRPVFIYLYVHFLLSGINKIRINLILHFIPFMIIVFYLFPFFIQSSTYKIGVHNKEFINTIGIIPDWYLFFQYLYSFLYLVLALVELRKYVIQNQRPNKPQIVTITWVKYLLVGGAVYLTFPIILQLIGVTSTVNNYMSESFSILMIFLCIKLLTLPDIISINLATKNKYRKSSIPENDIQNYFTQINHLMENESLYKRNDLKLSHLAYKLNIQKYLVSQIINEKSGKSFRDYVNEFRIEEAKKILQSSNQKFSIEGTAHQTGFKSRASFYSAFKKFTNLTPSEYLNSIK